MLLKSASCFFAAFLIGLVEGIENVNQDCLKLIGGVNFMAWVVRIMRNDPADPSHHWLDLATGNIITEYYVITACSPFDRIITEERWGTIRVVPTWNNYSKAVPDRDKAIFPYGSATDSSSGGCVVGMINVTGYELMSAVPCNKNLTQWPDRMINNLILLKLSEPLDPGDDVMFPRMPFSYNNEPILQKINWFNMFRRARCVIARWKPTPSQPRGTSTVIPFLFETSGFHYRTMAYRRECVPAICEADCKAIVDEVEKADCHDNCTEHMQKHLGALMCIVRMDEKQTDNERLFISNFDSNDTQVEYNTTHPTVKDCEHDENGLIMGSPVVCTGEVIAIVTKCTPAFLVATSVVHVRHHILGKFDTSYMTRLVYLSDDSTNSSQRNVEE